MFDESGLALGALAHIHREITLFAVAGIIIGGIDDLLVDISFLVRSIWRSLFVYSRHRRMTTDHLPDDRNGPDLAIFVPAWQEANVIATTLLGMVTQWKQPFRIFVGAYPNDAATIAAIATLAQTDPRIHLVIATVDGPTTKADCLNRLWHAMLREEQVSGKNYRTVVLHDAEDLVHRDELRLFSGLARRFAMIQLPVRPLIDRNSPWIAGHYADEFAESHGKFIGVREAVGAAIPSAGVGCALSRGALEHIAAQRDGNPFDANSLTEDYEIGLRIAQMGGRTAFVRMYDGEGKLVCTQEHFPDTLDAAIRQKARWMVGISLAGWDRMGWHGGLRERWMRLHDRRALLSALVLFAAYLSVVGYGVTMTASLLGSYSPPPLSTPMMAAMGMTGALMLWRLIMRVAFTASAYGWRQGLLAIPRSIVANVIAMLSARRALAVYIGLLRGRNLIWDKTDHRPVQDA